MRKNNNRDYLDNGFLVVKHEGIQKKISHAKDLFENIFKPKFSEDSLFNRELIKRFADHPFVASIFTSDAVIQTITKEIGFEMPVKCGPTVTHYTSNDLTGAGYGLPFHQDYPSTGSSKKGIICWLNLIDAAPETHGIEILPGMHKHGLLKGEQQSCGYLLHEEVICKAHRLIPEILAGDMLIMSCYLPHRTHVNPDFSGWKLSLSQRYDDLSDSEWGRRGYKNAYGFTVDRELYLK